jgi:hypothetical protein
MEDNECKFCNKKFSNKFNLKNHQNNAKYCLELRKQDNNNFRCLYCKKNLSSKWSLDNHLDNCVNRLNTEIELKDKEIIQYKNYIEKLENQNRQLLIEMKDLALKAIEKPTYGEYTENRSITNSNNKMIDNRVLNMIPMNLTQNQIEETIGSKYTESHFMKGQKGVAEFCLKNILTSPDKKLMLKCTDPARKVFIYVDDEGKIQKDINADKFIGLIEEPVKKASKQIYLNIQDRYENPDEEEGYVVDDDRLNYATQKLVEISNLKSDNGEFMRRIIPSIS